MTRVERETCCQAAHGCMMDTARWQCVCDCDICAGLEPFGNTAGNPARFIVETFSAGRGDLAVTVLNPRGVQEPASTVFSFSLELT